VKQFVLTRQAERDLDQIKRFLIKKAGPTVTRKVFQEIRGAMKLLGNEPGAGHVREDLTSRPVKFWPVYSYLVVYDPGSNGRVN
jgi:antitoxin ParD1/3/4/toxin ParE1/3/4